MPEPWFLTLQRWGVGGGEEQTWPVVSVDTVIEAVRALADEQNAMLTLSHDPEAYEYWLGVNASDGQFYVSVQLDENTALDLVGNPQATGMVPYVRGGQLVSHPRKYLVTLDQAVAAATEFYHTGTINPTKAAWERQGPGSAWDEV